MHTPFHAVYGHPIQRPLSIILGVMYIYLAPLRSLGYTGTQSVLVSTCSQINCPCAKRDVSSAVNR